MSQVSENQGSITENDIRPYQLFMLLLCVYSLISLTVETFLELPDDEAIIIDAIDDLVCVIFLFDFFGSLVSAPSKLRFMKWGWIDLLSSIPSNLPMLEAMRAGRVVRIIRILRVLRGIRLARVLSQYLQRHRADGTILAVVFFSILLLLLSSVAILQVEKGEGVQIQSASDALWWAIVTMTTVGYGDKVPVTTAGRIIASVVMVCGVGLFGTLSGSVTSWILNPVEERQEVDLDSIHTELAAIHRRLESMSSQQRIVPADPQLDRLISIWPKLSEDARNAVEDIVKSRSV